MPRIVPPPGLRRSAVPALTVPAIPTPARSTVARAVFLVLALVLWTGCGTGDPLAPAADEPVVVGSACAGCFELASAESVSALAVDEGDLPGVGRTATRVQADLERMTGRSPGVVSTRAEWPSGETRLVIAGTLGHNRLIDGLVEDGRLNVESLRGRREMFEWHIVDDPAPGIDQALVIVGSDRRGTIYGLYELSAQAGVSAWEWWADVPIPRRESLFVRPVVHTIGEPAIRYRGIFLNDENPALLGFVNETFGGFNHRFYERVFELILRLKGNYLWPAMWGKALADDDSLSAGLAHEMGIVLGTSHHEPMMRAHVEWARYGKGPWNYEKNAATLDAFWADGIRRMGDHESLVTVGMRGDGDEPMTEGTAIALLERIVARQREIIGEVTGRDPADVSQVWALYKEVQAYYDAGMRVPDDVTLLFADDNWGNIRRLPPPGAPPREGGYGVYYHFDYVGDPRNYKWLNTNQIQRVQEQMNLAYVRGAREIWIVNVGDLKPVEFPTEFFLDFAWDPEAWPATRLGEYSRLWSARQFGSLPAAAIADLIDRYSRLAARRKPELVDASTYSLTRFREFERIVEDWQVLADEAKRVGSSLGAEYRDAYFQLVLFPVLAMENLHEMYHAAALNRLYAAQGRAETNVQADRVSELFARDRELTRQYHQDIAGGKWNHMMSQTHIGYTYWQQPEVDVPPPVVRVSPAAGAAMGVAVEGSEAAWPLAGVEPGADAAPVGDGRPTAGSVPRASAEPQLPLLDPWGPDSRWFEVFARGDEAFDVSTESGAEWVSVTPRTARIEGSSRFSVSVDWGLAPEGVSRIPIRVAGPGGQVVTLLAPVNRREMGVSPRYRGFVESDGVVVVEAEHYSRAVAGRGVSWVTIPGLGRTLSGVTPYPPDAEPLVAPGTPITPPGDSLGVPGLDGKSPRLEYSVYVHEPGEVDVHALFSPSLDVVGHGGLRYAISIDDTPARLVNLHELADEMTWRGRVAENLHASVTTHVLERAGEHVVRIWMVDPGIVLQRIVVTTGSPEERALLLGALGPPESRRYAPPMK